MSPSLSSHQLQLLFETAAGVPEPAGWALMLVGLVAVGGVMRSSKRLATA